MLVILKRHDLFAHSRKLAASLVFGFAVGHFLHSAICNLVVMPRGQQQLLSLPADSTVRTPAALIEVDDASVVVGTIDQRYLVKADLGDDLSIFRDRERVSCRRR